MGNQIKKNLLTLIFIIFMLAVQNTGYYNNLGILKQILFEYIRNISFIAIIILKITYYGVIEKYNTF